jgi:DNA-binding MarR family transcriptional regulator
MLKVSVPTVQRGLRRLEGASFITRETVADDRVIVLHPEGDGRAAIFELRVMNAG